ncbi:hypothetical protein [Legionella jordanis]|uniref:Phasin protein n=1 Tax=Legionella jordanis TaxID=456 RepID=A0A0W0V9N5_9GAMM|nr:hypothetical protein [Legionella jordanis]KTD16788.1 hypothetical protein Ljor_1094 [Legionella jordanis]VEH11744.1 Uncharacterised protein [Legionella jordanis]
MNQDYFRSWAALVNEMHKPFQAMVELNIRTLQNLHYLRPEEAANWQQPNRIIDNQLKMAMENSHQMLDYMRQSFQIMENAFSSVSRELSKHQGGRPENSSFSKDKAADKNSASDSKTGSSRKSSKTEQQAASAAGNGKESKSKSSSRNSSAKMTGSASKLTASKKGTSNNSQSLKKQNSASSANRDRKSMSGNKTSEQVVRASNPTASSPNKIPAGKIAMSAAQMSSPNTKIRMPEHKHSTPNDPAAVFKRQNDKMPEPKK